MAIPLLAQPGETVATDRHRRVAIAIAELRSEPDRILSLDELAEAASYSRYHFVRTFREVTGTSPGMFQTALRFARASDLLLTTPASVTEICGEVGYTSLGTFSDRFRELVGVSPTALRELPHRTAALQMTALERITLPPDRGGCRVQVVVPDTVAGLDAIYLGLFRDGVASGVPVAGTMVRRPGFVTLAGFPPGRYHVLAAAFPSPIEGLGHLLPSGNVLVGATGQPITITPAASPVRRLAFRPLAPTDAPILTALPALVLARLSPDDGGQTGVQRP